MRAVLCNAFGPPEDLVVADVSDPSPGPGEVLIEVKAAPVTFPDTLMLEDKYQFKADLPYVPGAEVAGVVTSLGEGVDDVEVGTRPDGSQRFTPKTESEPVWIVSIDMPRRYVDEFSAQHVEAKEDEYIDQEDTDSNAMVGQEQINQPLGGI